MAGNVTSSAGTWAMPRTSTITASTPAHGIPATSRATPTMMAWIKATPSTPWATIRAVAQGVLGVAHDPLKDRQAIVTARLPKGHDDTGDDEGGQELQHTPTDAGDQTQGGFRQFAYLRLHT